MNGFQKKIYGWFMQKKLGAKMSDALYFASFIWRLNANFNSVVVFSTEKKPNESFPIPCGRAQAGRLERRIHIPQDDT